MKMDALNVYEQHRILRSRFLEKKRTNGEGGEGGGRPGFA